MPDVWTKTETADQCYQHKELKWPRHTGHLFQAFFQTELGCFFLDMCSF